MRLIIFGLLFLYSTGFSQIKVPKLNNWVNDTTQTLTIEQKKQLNDISQNLEQLTQAQLATLIITTTQPYTIEEYASVVFEKWQLGQHNKDNGVLLLIALNDRTIRIEVGYGLEGQITDLIANRIIQNTLVPAFKQQNYGEGVIAANEMLASLISGKTIRAPSYEKHPPHPNLKQFSVVNLLTGIVKTIAVTIIPAFFCYMFSKLFITCFILIATIALKGKAKAWVFGWLDNFMSMQDKYTKTAITEANNINTKETSIIKVKPFSLVKLFLTCGWLLLFNHIFAEIFLNQTLYTEQLEKLLTYFFLPFSILTYQVCRYLPVYGLRPRGGVPLGNSGFMTGSSNNSGSGSCSGNHSSSRGSGGRSGGGGSSGRW